MSKTIVTYSGKGGVGKSTITYGLYLSFLAQGKDVIVVDMDLNTPSMGALMGDDNPDLIAPPDFGVFVDKVSVRRHIREVKQSIKSRRPDVVLIDTPPSITDIHHGIISSLKVSGIILVSTGSELSRRDVIRTVPAFAKKGFPIIGLIENMLNEGEGFDYVTEVLAQIPRVNSNDLTSISQVVVKALAPVVVKLEDNNIKNVIQEFSHRTLFDETVTWEDVKRLYGILEDEEDGYYWSAKSSRNGMAVTPFNKVKFVNMSTWGKLREAMYEHPHSIAAGHLGHGQEHFEWATVERVERVLNAFREDKEAKMIIIKSPLTEIPTVPMEVGTCTLTTSDMHHGLPCVNYHTDQGPIKLFPHEVQPLDARWEEEFTRNHHFYNDTMTRWFPHIGYVNALVGTFGLNRLGMPGSTTEDMETHYQKVTGTLQEY